TAVLALVAAFAVAAPAVAQVPDWRTPDPQNTLVIDTNKGRIIVEMEPALADAHVERLRTLARRKFYDGLKFFRVIEDFMDQTGDPQNTGEGDSDLPNLDAQFSFARTPKTPFTQISRDGGAVFGFVGATPVQTQPDELMALMATPKVSGMGLFCPGVLGMARSEDPHSGNSQFFLMRGPFPRLNGQYTAFGRVISGLDVVRAIKLGEPVPEPMDRMTLVRVLADMPEAERPKIQVQNTAGPAFKAYAESVIKAKGPAFNICDLEIKSDVR
ncbi:MAG TPA: peptidylprolyl isomerase, partial [Caulobacteraceae bacterium]|nr:peptidylprolyl isomerase [Caulobacteraceae bacterium]